MTTPPEALREMGAEFHHAAAKCDDALHALESARQDRITFLREAIKRNEERLSDIKEEVRRLPEQIAKWEAERARLESQTGLDLLRAVVAERGEKTGEPSPNRFDCEECGTGVSADEDGCCATCGRTCWQWVNGECVLAGGAEPEEMPADRAEVEKMADRDRIIGDTPLVETIMLAEEAAQPTTKPPEDDDPVEKAFWRFCMLIDKTQRAARVKAGYLEGPYPQRDAFKIAVRSTVLGVEEPKGESDG